MILARNKIYINEQKLQSRIADGLSIMIQERIGIFLADKKSNIKIRSMFEIFPELFEKDVKEIEEKRKQRELEEYKIKFKQMAERINARKGALNE